MGRIGDTDIHQAFVEFRAKESDKCLSAQCLYCQSVRAKNTSRQRAHLLECQPFLTSMRDQNPDHPILTEHLNGPPPSNNNTPGGGSTAVGGPIGGGTTSSALGTPSSAAAKVINKKRDHDVMTNGATPGGGTSNTPFQGGVGGGFGAFGAGMWAGGQGHVPKPIVERDFQMSLQVNPRIGVGPTIWGQKGWVSFVSGHWSGRWGKGTVVPGGSSTFTSAPDLSTRTESTLVLQTHDTPAANIHLRTEGWLTGPRDIVEKLEDPAQADDVDPKSYSWKMYMRMETGDGRHLSLNTGMWIGSGVRRGMEVIYDAYRIM